MRAIVTNGARAAAAWWGDHAAAQLGLLAGTVLLFAVLGANTLENMERFGIRPGFEFLHRAANFEIGESLVAYTAGDTYGRALLVGLLNTVKVAVLGCVLATALGLALGIARLSGNLLLSGIVQVYVELIRSTPLLLQLFFWSATLHALPGPRQAFQPVAGVFLCNRGVFLPALRFDPLGWDIPQLAGFNFTGGATLTPEFAALLIGLAVNAAAGIAEIVRSGVQSVPAGQWEAARALGLPRRRILRLVVLPQALRVIVPLLTSSWLSLTKNSSLAVAIGFPDLVSVINTSANQTGQALETMAILAAAYLTLSLAVSVAMNAWNRRLARRGWP
ncbi:ABC transporter permease subunit [Azospirillum sp. TSO22-1]|uniref:amino acid ABC transporter permease n=1 Tax=Azospirillum sp. TSO22-1 TaxID=716789 RepID=UPI000D60875C|nr:ABC transporter permease subunit [Azospirillum sp. TSO22-1]PWC44944.1 hypothetical protein TSO221_16480 [Azospirillum sp. TSO22-1]